MSRILVRRALGSFVSAIPTLKSHSRRTMHAQFQTASTWPPCQVAGFRIPISPRWPQTCKLADGTIGPTQMPRWEHPSFRPPCGHPSARQPLTASAADHWGDELNSFRLQSVAKKNERRRSTESASGARATMAARPLKIDLGPNSRQRHYNGPVGRQNTEVPVHLCPREETQKAPSEVGGPDVKRTLSPLPLEPSSSWAEAGEEEGAVGEE